MKTLKHSSLALLVAACFSGAAAAPTLPQVVNGQATFSQQGNVFSITNTPNTIINWQSFSVNPGEVTRFIQQSDSSAVLNRILGQDPSQILGALQSNGRVFLINPNGILFGRDSRVDVNGLVASTLNLSNADFLAGKQNFAAGTTAGKVSNQGAITTASGGQVFLIAPNVENAGIISSPKGEVVLAAGHTVQLVDSANPDLHVVVSAPASQAINLGQVIAQGGKVGIYGALINQRGMVNANSALVGENGKIVFKASGDTLLEAGSVTSATGAGKGGEIHVLGERVGLTGDAQVDASGNAGGGTVLIGGDYQGKNAAIQHAQQVFIDKGVVVNADAQQGGDGGKVIAWSDGITRAYGTISARGGAAGGNGGFVETSGKSLDMQGRVDTRAPMGTTGTLLLDPSNIFIANDQTSATGNGMVGSTVAAIAGSIFSGAGTGFDSLLTVATLQSSLATSSVTVQTTNASGGGAGNIMVFDPISWASASQLTLSADSNIFVNAGITGTAGVLSLRAYGGNINQIAPIKVSGLLAYADVGSVALNSASNQVSTLAGYAGASSTGFSFVNSSALTVGTVAGSNGIRTNNATPVSLNTSVGNLDISNVTYGIDAAGGVVTLNATAGSVLVSGPVKTTGSGTATLNGASGVSMSGSGSISTAGGAVSITATALDAPFAMGANTQISTAGGQIAITADKMTLGGTAAGGAISSGSGPVSLNTRTAGANIWLGAAGSDLTTGTLELSSTELNSIATPVLRVAASGAGNIVIRSPLTNGAGGAFERLSGTSTLALNTGTGGITQLSGATIGGVSQLSLAGGWVDLSQSNPTGVVSGATSGQFWFRSANQVTLGYVDGIHGITAGTETKVVLTSDNYGISQSSGNPLRVPSGVVVLDAAGPAVLTESGNQFRYLAAALSFRAPGASAITASGDLEITSTLVGDTTYSGVATNNQNLQLTSPASIWLAAPVVTTGAVTLTAGAASSPNVSNVVTFESTVTAGGGLTVNANRVAGSLAPVAGPGVVLNVVAVALPPPPPPPTLAACIANPSLSGCSAVLPTLAQCISQPAAAGCSVILPSLPTCVSSPATAGCSVVLPSFATCVSSPATAGCSVVLPSFATCVSSPATAGCSVVLPSFATCFGSPTTAGCSVVLPSLATCTASPTTAGCSAVLPGLATCIATPTAQGCSVVLPTLPSCIAKPSTDGCVVVLPSLATCIGSPSFAGCSVVLPTIAACIVTPTTAGCSVVLPTLPQCIATPAALGCSTVLPKLAACIAAPATAGCSVVLPTLTQCVAAPAAAGCAVVLPTLDQCIGSPSLQGCSVVLPTLAQCAATPAQEGCKAVLPTTSYCSTHPADAACVALNPPSAPEEGKVNTPIGQAVNTTINIINAKSREAESRTGGGGANTGTSGTGNTDGKGKSDTGPSAGTNTGVNSNAPTKKTFCN